METGTEYLSYVNDTKNFRPFEGRKQNQDKYENAFSAIYAKAQGSDINLDNAKSFLNDLSESEMQTLKQYAGMAQNIDTDTLSSEGAYNLLMHDYEKYDFNGDGITQIGEAKGISLVPSSMPNDVREAYIKAMNTLNDEDKLLSSVITLGSRHLESTMTGKTTKDEAVDYAYLKKQVDAILNPELSSSSSEKFKSTIRQFWQAFETNYSGDRSSATDEKVDLALQKFRNDLHTKGASKFLADLNKEKIEEKVQEFRDKLLKEMGDSPEALKEIDKQVTDYRKQLLEELENSLDSNKKKIFVNSGAIIQALLDMKNGRNQPLNELLKSNLSES